ncbi:hypothetical protein [Neptunomonas sp.]|uniref:hypothetical protein n=1 Tax=Neptunomonas sp. TaxID=1971898 RepID=UPI003567F93F
MSFDTQALFALLPAIHRIRDAEMAQANGLERGPLEELIGVLAEQISVADESLEQLYDDLFIETCAEWVVPYIGDLIGYQSLHNVVAKVASSRAEVAHTIALRRRKGTALVLEQLARDVTGWDARAVEYFQRLNTTQYMNHPRLGNLQSPDLRKGDALEWTGSAFETANRTVNVRRIESSGRHNIPNVGLHLWRIQAYPRTLSAAHREGPHRYRINPLGFDMPLYNHPQTEVEITHLADPDNVPWPMSRRRMHHHLERYYGERASVAGAPDNPNPSLQLFVDGILIERDKVRICNLSDDGVGWANSPPPAGIYAIDPQLGRVALPAEADDPADVRLNWHEGFSADIGGGEYERGDSLPVPADLATLVRVPDQHLTLASALAAIAGNGVIEITDNSSYRGIVTINVADEGRVEIRASNNRRPVLDLGGFTVTGGENSSCILNGLVISGAPVDIADEADNQLAMLDLVHCTLVPGISLNTDGSSRQAGAASLIVAIDGVDIDIQKCIMGAIRCHERSSVRAADSCIDANNPEAVAYAGLDGESPGAVLSLLACTLIGKVHASEMSLISNSILLAALSDADTWVVPVRAERKQAGCVRFSWLPFSSIVPARYHCQPDSVEAGLQVTPRFTSLHYGTPAYGQLAGSTPDLIFRGADDESEMGVFHHLYGAQRETNLRIRLAEYLRVGLRAGIFYES